MAELARWIAPNGVECAVYSDPVDVSGEIAWLVSVDGETFQQVPQEWINRHAAHAPNPPTDAAPGPST